MVLLVLEMPLVTHDNGVVDHNTSVKLVKVLQTNMFSNTLEQGRTDAFF